MKMSNTIRNEQGVALIVVLVIAAIVLVIMTAMIYMLTTGTKISGTAKRYTTATQAAEGGAAIARVMVDYKDKWDPGNLLALNQAFQNMPIVWGNITCASRKLHNGVSNWGACDGSEIDITKPATYDYMIRLGDYEIYSKITYTVKGNSQGTGGTGVGGVGGGNWVQTAVTYSSGFATHKGSSTGSGGEVTNAHYEYLYNVDIDAVNVKDKNERARLSMLYQY